MDRTTIIDKHGFIDDSGHLGCNNIPKVNLTPEGINAYLKMKTGMEVNAFELGMTESYLAVCSLITPL